ncbi:hypothetical protein JWJ90_12960 [Desulfobulbus rhabdoformis]|uniref:hypothetical protein n=1 Tax=Desulfobulbus rhabdoformis TaxID=34032 RepID=UPI0019657756|nr:hypothetical protein [Desulfobulbus rhabdoformis]MBM9615190.1 hypothetical protein [Desulfobulbus rhabdoformis]
MKKYNLLGTTFLILSAVFVFSNANAATSDYGKWEKDPAVKEQLETGKLLPNHTYYYTGSINGPDCFIALDNNYTLRDSNIWAKADEMSDKVMKSWLQSLTQERGDRSLHVQGGDILTPDGEKAGVWYSHYSVNVIEMPNPGELVIFQPHPVGGKIPGQD